VDTKPDAEGGRRSFDATAREFTDYLGWRSRRRRTRAGLAAAAPAPRVLATLLDRSLAQSAEAAADARSLDRDLVLRLTDAWEHNVPSFVFSACAGTARARERSARAALYWMAEQGPERLSWIKQQADAAGLAVDALLPQPDEEHAFRRDERGEIVPHRRPLDTGLATVLATDYDLKRADIRTLRVERAGTRLTALVSVDADRRYDASAPAAPDEQRAVAVFRLDQVSAVDFDAEDRTGISLRCGSEGVVIGLGAAGELRAERATVDLVDARWHRSADGQHADTWMPTAAARHGIDLSGAAERDLTGSARIAAALLQWAVLGIRSAGRPEQTDQVTLRALCRALDGAGQDVLAAGGYRSAARRERAFRALVQRGTDALAAEGLPWPESGLGRPPDWLQRPAAAAAAPRIGGTTPGPETELRLAYYHAPAPGQGRRKRAAAAVHLAEPAVGDAGQQSPWRLRALTFGEPQRFVLTTAAFRQPARPTWTALPGDLHAFALNGGALTVHTDGPPESGQHG
jgi:hypothetical protein